MFLKGKTALITGSTSGIGGGYAKALAAEGAAVMINGFGDQAEIETLRQELESLSGAKAAYSNADMTKPEEIRQMAADCAGKLGPVDILINNAGIQHVAPVDEFPEDKWNAIMDIICNSAFHTTKAVLPAMKERGWGRIITMSSVNGQIANTGRGAYSCTKGGVDMLTRLLAAELVISVNLLQHRQRRLFRLATKQRGADVSGLRHGPAFVGGALLLPYLDWRPQGRRAPAPSTAHLRVALTAPCRAPGTKAGSRREISLWR